MKPINIEKILEDLRSSEPYSSIKQLEDFEESSVYHDLQREWQLWIDDLRKLSESGEGSEPFDFYRGGIQVLFKVLETSSYIKTLINDFEENRDE